MPYKTILVHLNDKRRAEALLEPAIGLASQSNAHLIGMHIHSSMPAPPIPVPYGSQVLGAVVAAERKDTEEIAATFARMTAKQPFVAEWRALKVPHVDLAAVVMDHGRAADLIVAGQTDPDWDLSPLLDFPERLALESGRPVLVVPYVGRYPTVGRNVVIAWKPGRELARAVFDALASARGRGEGAYPRDQGARRRYKRARTRYLDCGGAGPPRHQAVGADLGGGRHQHRRRDPLAPGRPRRRSPGDGRLRPLAHARDGIRRRHAAHRPAHDGADAALALRGYLKVEQVPPHQFGRMTYDRGYPWIAFTAVLWGATSCCEMPSSGRTKLRFLKRFLKLKHGIPSHDTFSTVLRMIDPKALDAAFGSLTATLLEALTDGGVIAIDGKSLRVPTTRERRACRAMMITAYAADLRLTLGSLEAKGASEVEAALSLIGLIDLKRHIVTTDALQCHRRMAAAVTAKGGDYCFTLKGNREGLLSDARACLSKAKKRHATAKSETRGHGREETRVGIVVKAPDIAQRHNFPGLKAFGRIEATREVDGKIETDVRIFALSRELAPQALLNTVRAHWDIENGLHWQLDVTLREDAARNRRDNGPANIAVLRRRALDVARRDTSKGSLAIKLKRAGWDHDFLLHMLGQMR